MQKVNSADEEFVNVSMNGFKLILKMHQHHPFGKSIKKENSLPSVRHLQSPIFLVLWSKAPLGRVLSAVGKRESQGGGQRKGSLSFLTAQKRVSLRAERRSF